MTAIIPEHLSIRNLPNIPDILYHNELTFFHPTGFTLNEFTFINDLYKSLINKQVKLPLYFWNMYSNYFELSKEFCEATKILSPLIDKKHIKIGFLVYDRHLERLNKTKDIYLKDSNIYNLLSQIDIDFRLFDREFLSHIWQESLEKRAYKIEEYILEITRDFNSFLTKYYSLLINKLLFIQELNISPSFQNIQWYNLMVYLNKYSINKNIKDVLDSSQVEMAKHRLFYELTYPLFGDCNSYNKSLNTVKIIKKKQNEINKLKEECENIAIELLKVQTSNPLLIKKVLEKELNNRIINPLSKLSNYNTDKIKDIIKSFVLDSTVMATFFSTMVDEFSIKTIGTSVGAGIVTSLGKNFIIKQNEVEQNKLICNQIKKSKVDINEYIKTINEIKINSIIIDTNKIMDKY